MQSENPKNSDPLGSTLNPTANPTHDFDVVVVGAGAAGLFCAGVAGQLGLKVLVLDHSERIAEKVRIAGGGRCNFTNVAMDARDPGKHFISENSKFCRSALSRYTPQHFIELVNSYGIAWHEKHRGQLFCDQSSEQIISMLLAECAKGGVTRWQPCNVETVHLSSQTHESLAAVGLDGKKTFKSVDCPTSTAFYCYYLHSNLGLIRCNSLVVATGGLSIPKIGATDWGYRIAKQARHRIVPTRPALVPLTFDALAWQPYAQLSGLSLPVNISSSAGKGGTTFSEDLLFTHRGLSGPGVLQISSYWKPGEAITINFLPNSDLAADLATAKNTSKKNTTQVLAAWMPQRLASALVAQMPALERPINEVGDKPLQQLARLMTHWQHVPNGSEGYRKAEVTAGGVDTQQLSSQTMESKLQPGLYFVGEVVDVTGWLGGYNFQWAWASAFACAHGLLARSKTVASI